MKPQSEPTVLVLAGEESGDLHGAAVVRGIRDRIPGVRFIGLGGPRMEAEGVELIADLDRLAVMGFAEPIRHLPFFYRLFRRIRGLIRSGGVDLVLAVDYPGFNLRMVRVAHEEGVPVLYYIVPQFWAWKGKRVQALARDTDRIAVLLPFEEEPLRAAGADAHFVGHPLLGRLAEPGAPREEVLASAGLDPERPVLALFPGSRRQEIHRHLALFSEAAALVVREHPDLQPVIARAPSLAPDALAGATYPVHPDPDQLLRHAQVAIVKSGTSTLEAAVAGVPAVCAYRTHPFTFFWAKRLARIPFIALPNLIVEEGVIPEYIQDEATPESLAAGIGHLEEDGSPARRAMLAGFERVRARMGEPGAGDRVALMAVAMLEGGEGSGARSEGGA